MKKISNIIKTEETNKLEKSDLPETKHYSYDHLDVYKQLEFLKIIKKH